MPKYEVVYIVEPEKTDEQVAHFAEEVKSFVAREGGVVDHVEQWGKKKLAYTITKNRYGHYTLLHVTGPGEIVAKLERFLNINESVVKFLTLKHHEKTMLRPTSEAPAMYQREGGRF